ncbi:MAG: hypothetical protein QM679_11950 [Patulibacter sp.]
MAVVSVDVSDRCDGEPVEGQLYLLRDEQGRDAALMLWRETYPFVYQPSTGHFRPGPQYYDRIYGFDLRSRWDLFPIDEQLANILIRSGLGPTSDRPFADEPGIPVAEVIPPRAVVAAVLTDRERAVAFAQALTPGSWEPYKTYPPGKRANASAAANQIRSGRIKAFPRGDYDARIRRLDDGQVIVEVMKLDHAARRHHRAAARPGAQRPQNP